MLKRSPEMHATLKPLEVEIDAFEKELPALRKKLAVGTFVLFVGSDCVGDFESYSQALEAGYEKAGMEPFLVKQISQEGEDVQYVYGLQA